MAGTKMKSVALLSGGLDSVVATNVAARKPGGVALALTFDYGQRSARREAKAARAVASELGITWKLIKLPWLAELLPAALGQGAGTLPRPKAEELESTSRSRETARAVWVPNRNGVFLNIAAAHAEAIGAGSVVAGFNKEEAATFPDNSADYMKRVSSAFALSTRNKVRVVSPTARLDKAAIVRLGMKLGAPLDKVWSCYSGGTKMCAECESCSRLLRALVDASAPRTVWPVSFRSLSGSADKKSD